MNHDEFAWIREELRWHAQLLYALLSGQQVDIDLDRREVRVLKEIREELKPRLSSIKIRFGGTMPVGPVTISVGQTVVASVVGFDQNGAPFTGTIPAATFAIDNPGVATIDAASGLTTGVSGGTANATASVTSAEGLALTDTETVNVTAVVPVLSSIKISFDPAAVAAVRR